MICRIVDNAHLLDATEIFRKLNVHKKVRYAPNKLLMLHLVSVPVEKSWFWIFCLSVLEQLLMVKRV